MPKTAYLAEHFSSSELKEKYLKSQNSVEMRRWHLLWKISLGWTIKNSASAVGCSYPYAQKILHGYNLNGEEGVKNRKNQTSNHVRGKERLLSQPQLEKLTRALEKQPPDAGQTHLNLGTGRNDKLSREQKTDLTSENETQTKNHTP